MGPESACKSIAWPSPRSDLVSPCVCGAERDDNRAQTAARAGPRPQQQVFASPYHLTLRTALRIPNYDTRYCSIQIERMSREDLLISS